jgi:hypothetical protein
MLGDGFVHAAVCSTRVTGYWLPYVYKYIIYRYFIGLKTQNLELCQKGSFELTSVLQGLRDGFPMILDCCVDSTGLLVLGNHRYEITMGRMG